MFISLGHQGELKEVYLHRSSSSEPDVDRSLSAWVRIGDVSINLAIHEIPRLIAALDAAYEKAEEIPADARGTVWKTRIERATEVPVGETP